MTLPAMPYRTKGLDHVVLRAKDIDKMLGFYRDVLGLPVAKHNEPLGLWHLKAGTSMIDLVDMFGPLGEAGGLPHPALVGGAPWTGQDLGFHPSRPAGAGRRASLPEASEPQPGRETRPPAGY